MALLEVRDLSFTYAGQTSPALKNASLTLQKGEFMCVCGATGSGKSTLLRLLKAELRPEGLITGDVRFDGTALSEMEAGRRAAAIGYVCQRPEQQIVTDKVWHELAFGLENLGIKPDVIRRRVSEMACWFGIEGWFEKSVSELSGGQKQLLNLASVMVMQPDVLLLDEPTSQLDPIAASDFIATVSRLNRELSTSVIMVEHRLEEVLPVCDSLLVMQNGTVHRQGPVREVVSALPPQSELMEYMPAAVRIFAACRGKGSCPLTVKEGRRFVRENFTNEIKSLPARERELPEHAALEFENVYFRYEKSGADVLNGLSFSVREGEIFCVLGGNGAGKSTCLAAAAGINRPYAGKIRVFGKNIRDYKHQSLYRGCLSLLPQDVQTVFLESTVEKELKGVDLGSLPFDLSGLLTRHPYDLSGGQQQLTALAKVLAQKPRLLLLDEPTKGLDAHTRSAFIGVIRQLNAEGMTVVCVTHDVEFAAQTADRCALFFKGGITSCEETHRFFEGNSFYTTASNRIARDWYEGVITSDEAARLCLMNGGGSGE